MTQYSLLHEFSLIKKKVYQTSLLSGKLKKCFEICILIQSLTVEEGYTYVIIVLKSMIFFYLSLIIVMSSKYKELNKFVTQLLYPTFFCEFISACGNVTPRSSWEKLQ